MTHDQPTFAVAAADGHRFELIYVPSAGPPEASLLLLPGMGLSARRYIDFARALAQAGLECFIHEWRGFGSSSLRAGRGRDWGYRELLNVDLPAARQQFEKQAKGADRLLGGHSLGAQLACLSMARSAQGIDQLVVIASGVPYWRTFSPLKRMALLAACLAWPMLTATVGYFPGRQLGFAGREARGVIADWAWTARRGRYDLPGLSFDPESALRSLNLPLIALRQADDWYVPPASLERLLAKCPDCPIERRVVSAGSSGRKADHFHFLHAPGPTVSALVEAYRCCADDQVEPSAAASNRA